MDHKVRKAIFRGKPIGLLEHLRRRDPKTERNVRKAIDEIYDYDMSKLEKLVASRSQDSDTRKIE